MTTTTNDDLKKHLGQLILEGYKSKGLTRMDLAKELGVDVRSITSYTQGDAIPRVSKRQKLESFLGWREGAIQEFLVEANSGTPLDTFNLKWMGFGVETDTLGGVSAEDLADELLRRLRNSESRVRSLQRQLEAAREEAAAQPDYGLAAHGIEDSMADRFRRDADGVGEAP